MDGLFMYWNKVVRRFILISYPRISKCVDEKMVMLRFAYLPRRLRDLGCIFRRSGGRFGRYRRKIRATRGFVMRGFLLLFFVVGSSTILCEV